MKKMKYWLIPLKVVYNQRKKGAAYSQLTNVYAMDSF